MPILTVHASFADASRKRLAAALLLAALGLSACGGGDQSTEDAHDLKVRCGRAGVTSNTPCLDDSQKTVIAFPNHFKNIATACDGHGHRIFETTSGELRIYADPSCPGWTEDTSKTGVAEIQGR